MFFDHFISDLEKRLTHLGQRLLRGLHGTLLADARILDAEIRSTRDSLSTSQDAIANLRKRLSEHELQMERLTRQIETCIAASANDHAWPFALELDDLRHQKEKDEALLPRYEQQCWSYDLKLRQLRRKQQRLAEDLESVKG